MVTKTDQFPIPLTKKQCIYPVAELAVGESFRVDGKNINSINLTFWRKRTGFGLIARTMTDADGTKHIRVWRIS